ncbi:MAG: hypothetical protein WC860_05115 [Candidatus Margulisiibacteriota bacterium]|jgi:flagellar biosynthesis/type III secretory pathway M-ring protein FliF/YscJ
MGEIFNNEEAMEIVESNPKRKSFLNSPLIKITILSIVVIIVIIGLIFFMFKGLSPKASNKVSVANLSGMQTESSSNQRQLEQEISRLKVDLKKQEEKKKKEKPLKIEYELLYENMDADQTSAVLQELSIDSISFSIKQKGKYYDISVDKDKYEEAKNILAIRGLPSGGIKGYELFDKSDNLGVTEFDKKIRFVRAISGELEKAIMQINAIEYCKVQIVLPDQKFFSTKQPPVTASILIRKKRGYVKIKPETVVAIIKLVANSVEDLKPENITVVDTEGNVVSKNLFKSQSPIESQITLEDESNALGIDVNTEEKIVLLATSSSANAAFSGSENKEDLLLGEDKATLVLENNEKQVVLDNQENIKPKQYPSSNIIGGTSWQKKQDITQAIVISSANNKASEQIADEISKQNEIKANLANILGLKITKKLEALLPKDNYLVSTEIEIRKFYKDFPIIDNIKVIVNINQNNPSIQLTPELKNNIFKVVTDVIPYQKKRDSIVIAWSADFSESSVNTVMNNFNVSSSNMISSAKIKKMPLFIYQLNRLKNKYFEYFILGIGLVLSLMLLLILGFIFFKKKLPKKVNVGKLGTDAATQEKTIVEELNQEKKTFEQNLEKLQNIAIKHPDILAKVVEDLLNNHEELIREEVIS